MPQFRTSDGAPLRGIGGYPMDDCCCDSSSCTPGGPCSPCCPHMSTTYTMTFSGLGGTFASENGAHALYHLSSCTWRDQVPTVTTSPFVQIVSTAGYWYTKVEFFTPGIPRYRKEWRKAITDICVQTPDGGIYVEYSCFDDDAGVSCAASVGATCVVSIL